MRFQITTVYIKMNWTISETVSGCTKLRFVISDEHCLKMFFLNSSSLKLGKFYQLRDLSGCSWYDLLVQLHLKVFWKL